MEQNNQRPNWPPAPTVKDKPASSDQSATIPGVQNDAPTSADGAHAHTTRDPTTPVNNGPTTPAKDNAPTTPVNAAAADPPVDRVQIVLKDQTGAQVAFGVKSNTRMEKVQNAYADRAGRPVSSLRFFFDGHRVLPDDTVATLDMDNEDIIEVMTEQIGGNGKCNTAPTHLYEHDVPSKGVSTRAGTPEDTIHIAVEYRAQNGLEREIRCKMTKTMSFDKFVDLHSKHWGVDPSAQHLTYNGKTVFLSDTPAPIGAEHGAVLNVVENPDFFAMDLTLG